MVGLIKHTSSAKSPQCCLAGPTQARDCHGAVGCAHISSHNSDPDGYHSLLVEHEPQRSSLKSAMFPAFRFVMITMIVIVPSLLRIRPRDPRERLNCFPHHDLSWSHQSNQASEIRIFLTLFAKHVLEDA